MTSKDWKIQGLVKWLVFIEGKEEPHEHQNYFPDGAATEAVKEYDGVDEWLAQRSQRIQVRVKHPDQDWEATYTVEGDMRPHYYAWQIDVPIR